MSSQTASENEDALGLADNSTNSDDSISSSMIELAIQEDPSIAEDSATSTNIAYSSDLKKSAPNLPVNEYLKYNNVVKLYVGLEKTLWILNEGLLCDRIPYFKMAFQGNFKEGKEKSMELQEDDPAIFAKLVDWVYSGRVECGYCCRGESEKIGATCEEEHDILWCSLWILADKYSIEDLANATVNRLQSCFSIRTSCRNDVFISADTVDYVYKNTMGSSALRPLIVEQVLYYYFCSDGDDDRDARLKDFTTRNDELNLALLNGIHSHILAETRGCIWDVWGHESRCFYHRMPRPTCMPGW